MYKIGRFQRNLSRMFLKKLHIYLVLKIFQKVRIVMLPWNILQYETKMLWQYFNYNEILEIFLTCFCNILWYVGRYLILQNSGHGNPTVFFRLHRRIWCTKIIVIYFFQTIRQIPREKILIFYALNYSLW